MSLTYEVKQKNIMKRYSVFFIILAIIFIMACTHNEQDDAIAGLPPTILNLPDQHYNYDNIALPDHYVNDEFPDQFQFPAPTEYDNTPASNPITNAGATLGRVLFYDKQLSANGTIACASCHQAEHGFSDSNILSEGFEGGLTRRHSMSLVNARYYADGRFFWDERAASLEDQVLMPFQDDVEMGLTLEELVEIVNSQMYYPSLFEDAFGDDLITTERIAKAIAQFIRSMVSTTSKYDQARSQVQSPLVDFPDFSDQENAGKRLFYMPRVLSNGVNGNCVGCHQTELMIGPLPSFAGPLTSFATTNGLDATSVTDLGVFESTNNENDIGKFKVPSLRNIGVRPPYMHDGRFASLEEVVEHYSSGIQNHQSLINPLVNDEGEVGQFNFTDEEKTALVAFLHTLTDIQMLSDKKYSNPFE